MCEIFITLSRDKIMKNFMVYKNHKIQSLNEFLSLLLKTNEIYI